ncbi:MAG: hypothetical protein ACFFFH_14210, partial [Candidatus Thorarchaeota archaeon]
MSVKAFNPAQLKTELYKEIEEIRNQIKLKELPNKQILNLIEKLLFERELLFNEIDILKEARKRWIQRYNLNDDSLNLLIKEIDELLYNDFYNLSKRLNYNPGE